MINNRLVGKSKLQEQLVLNKILHLKYLFNIGEYYLQKKICQF